MKSYDSYTLNEHTYRTPSEIRNDMKHIISELSGMEEKLNLRELIVEALYKNEEKKPSELIRELNVLLEDADGALCEIEELKQTLAMLSDELSDCGVVAL